MVVRRALLVPHTLLKSKIIESKAIFPKGKILVGNSIELISKINYSINEYFF